MNISSSSPRPLADLRSDTTGGGFVEYMIIIGCVALLCIAAFTAFGGNVTAKITEQGGRVMGIGGGGP